MPSSAEYQLSCRCGILQANIRHPAPHRAIHVDCHCRYCRGYLDLLGSNTDTDAPVPLLLIPPDSLQFTKGRSYLRCMRLSRRGALRFYAGCCNTPLVNCHANLSVPLMTVHRTQLQAPEQHSFIRPSRPAYQANYPGRRHSWRFLVRMTLHLSKGWLQGSALRSPLRAADGFPNVIVEHRTLRRRSH